MITISGIDMFETGAQGGAFALIHLMGENADACIGLGELLHGLPGAVLRAIVDHHQFANFGAGQDAFDDEVQGLFLVVDGHDNSETGGRDFNGVHEGYGPGSYKIILSSD